MSLTVSPSWIIKESGSPLVAAAPGWQRRQLGEVATILNGYAFKSTEFVKDDGKPLIRIRDLRSDRTAVGYAGEYDDRYLVQPGDLLVGMDGDFNCARWRGPEALLNQRVCKVIPSTDDLDLDFLTHLLPGYLQAIHDVTSSITVAHLSSRDIARIPIPVPSMDEQRTLAGVLDAASIRRQSSVAHLKSAVRSIDRLRHAVLAAAYSGRLTKAWRGTHPVEESAKDLLTRVVGESSVVQPDGDEQSETPMLPESWCWSRCNLIINPSRIITYGVIKLGPPIEDGVSTLRSSDVRWLRVDQRSIKKISRAIADKYGRTYLQGGEVLVTVRGSLGGVAVAPQEMVGFNISREVAMVPVHPELDPRFVCLAIAAGQSQNWLSGVEKGVTYTGVNIRDLRQLPLPVPPIQEQREIVQRVDRLLALIDQLVQGVDRATSRIERTSHAVLAKALRGELVPSSAA